MSEIIVEAERDLYTDEEWDEIAQECVVRCKDCKKILPKGWRFDKYCNKAEHTACNLFSNHDFDWDYTSFFYVEADDYCVWGERRPDA